MRRLFLTLMTLGFLSAGTTFAAGIASGGKRPLKQPSVVESQVDVEQLVKQLDNTVPKEASLARPL